MTLTLYVGDYAYSSWSLRGWLLVDGFGLTARLRYAHMRTPEFEALREEMAPSLTVPALKIGEGESAVAVWDSLAVAETLHEHFPDAGLWPSDPADRAMARAITAEMHSGFTALRGACPMNMRRAYAGFEVSDDVASDLARLSTLWSHARTHRRSNGPFLFGAFSVVDAFFTPVASRIATYGLQMGPEDMTYVAALLGYPATRRWRALAIADPLVQQHYEMDLEPRPNPHDPALTGQVVPGLAAMNKACPYSGKPVAPDCVVQIADKAIGYCNPGCAAKTAADPYAWPATAALLDTL